MADLPRRNVHVFNSSNGTEVAGFFQHGGVSISTFVRWITQVCYIPVEWALYPCQRDNNHAVGGKALDSDSKNDIRPGRYVIRTLPPESAQVSVYLTTDVARTRKYSDNHSCTPHDTNFVARVRSRDARCCIGGHLVAGGDYTGFEAAHIFPLSETEIWNDLNYKRFIEDDLITPGFELNSTQQGFLCSATECRMFDDYSVGVNPDDNYRIYDFVGRDPNRTPHGKIFYRNPNERRRYLPSADLLRDHLRQCVLRHVKGAGESKEPQRPVDPDIDLRTGLTTGSRPSGSKGKGRLETGIAGRPCGAATTQIKMEHDPVPVPGPSVEPRKTSAPKKTQISDDDASGDTCASDDASGDACGDASDDESDDADDNASNDVLSLQQKKDLCRAILTIDGQKLDRVIQIIHDGVPEVRDNQEKIELEIDMLPASVLIKLHDFVFRPLRQSSAKRHRTGEGTGTGGLKRKRMDEGHRSGENLRTA